MIRAVCFDVGGTLLEERGEGFSARAARLAGPRPGGIREALVRNFYLEEKPIRAAVDEFCRDLGIEDSGPLWQELSRPGAESRLFPEVQEALKSLAGYRLATISNATPWNDSPMPELRGAGIFEFEVSSYRMHCAKPDARIFQAAEDRLGLFPEEIAMVGDSAEDDIAGAYRRGWKTVHLVRNPQAPPSHEADAVIHSLQGIRQVIQAL